MNPDSKPRSGGREATADTKKTDPAGRQTPQAVTQPGDTDPASSGAGGHGTPAQAAMKQQSKTESERGSER